MSGRSIRWALVIPVSALALVLVYYLVVLLSFIPLFGEDDGREVMLYMFGMFLANYAVVMAGAGMAPSRRLHTALVLSAVMAIFPAQYVVRSLAAGIMATRPLFALGFWVLGFVLACLQLWFYRWRRTRRHC